MATEVPFVIVSTESMSYHGLLVEGDGPTVVLEQRYGRQVRLPARLVVRVVVCRLVPRWAEERRRRMSGERGSHPARPSKVRR